MTAPRTFQLNSGLALQRQASYVQCMAEHDKVREDRLRRAARRQGLILEKSRRRDPRATDFGAFRIVNEQTSAVVASGADGGFGLNLDQVEEHLLGDTEQAPPKP